MRRSITQIVEFIVLSAAVVFSLAACDGSSKRGECQQCVVNKDCERGLTCEKFTRNGLTYRMCAGAGRTECRR